MTPRTVITRKIQLVRERKNQKQASKKRAETGELVAEEEKGRGASGKGKYNEGKKKVRNKKATTRGLTRTVH